MWRYHLFHFLAAPAFAWITLCVFLVGGKTEHVEWTEDDPDDQR